MNLLDLAPFPEEALSVIRDLPGNDKCCDCLSLDTGWANITHGSLICLDCAGKHRSLGVNVSTVRSISMDSWTKLQVEMMKQGGNEQLRRYFKRFRIDRSTIRSVYCSVEAGNYREKLKNRAEKVINGEIPSERLRYRKRESSNEKRKVSSERDFHRLSLDSIGQEIGLIQYSIEFLMGAMGMTLTKDIHGKAQVSKLVPAGQAETRGVKVGDYVMCVGGETLVHYDAIMDTIPLRPRPLILTFCRGLPDSPCTPGSERLSPSKSDNHLRESDCTGEFLDIQMDRLSMSGVSVSERRGKPFINGIGFGGDRGVDLQLLSTHIQPRVHSVNAMDHFSEHGGTGRDPKMSAVARRIKLRATKSTDQDLKEISQDKKEEKPRKPPRHRRTVSDQSSTRSLSKEDLDSSPLAEKGSFEGTNAVRSTLSSFSGEEGNTVGFEADSYGGKLILSMNSEDFFNPNSPSGASNSGLSSFREGDNHSDMDSLGHNSTWSIGTLSVADSGVFDSQHGKFINKSASEDHDRDSSFIADDEIQETDELKLNCPPSDPLDLFSSSSSFQSNKMFRSFTLEVGAVVRVKQMGTNKVRPAVLRRNHKDGSWKVAYRDHTLESHVQTNRIIPPNIKTQETKKLPKVGELLSGSLDDTNLKRGFNQDYRTNGDILNETEGGLKGSVSIPTNLSTFSDLIVERVQEIRDNLLHEINEFEAVFDEPPLGLTISSNGLNNDPVITRVASNSKAEKQGIIPGDVIIKINESRVLDYAETMKLLPDAVYPLQVRVQRFLISENSDDSPTVTQSMKEKANSYDYFLKSDLNKGTNKIDKKETQDIKPNNITSLHKNPVNIGGSDHFLPETPELPNDFDVVFNEVDLQFDIEEIIKDKKDETIIKNVKKGGYSESKGIFDGFKIIGINGKKYISFAHTAATLKDPKRPLTLRLRR